MSIIDSKSKSRLELEKLQREMASLSRSQTSETTSKTREQVEIARRQLEMMNPAGGSRAPATTSRTRLELEKIQQQMALLAKKESTTRADGSSKTRDQLELARKKLDEMKAETATKSKTTSRTRQQLEDINKLIAMEKQKLTSSKTKDEFEKKQRYLRDIKKSACEVDVAFMIDCTGSMASYINEAKQKVREIISEIKSRYNNCVAIGFVGYRDHCDSNRIERLDFTESPQVFEDFLDGIRADGGGDTCEDVFGGIEATINLSWKKQNRVIIHIGDAPQHGSRFHDLGSCSDNYYSDTTSDTKGLRIEDLIQQIKELKINYTFGKINSTTDKMIQVFSEIGGKDFIQSADLQEVKNFTFVSIQSISDSISCNWEELAKKVPKVNFGRMSAITESSEKTLKHYTIERKEPLWKRIKTIPAKIMKITVSDDPSNTATNVDTSWRTASIQISPHPFAEGGQRISYFGREIGKVSGHFFNSKYGEHASCVFKTFKHEKSGRTEYQECATIVETQAVSEFYARKFNSIKPREAKPVHFLDVKMVQSDDLDHSNVFHTLEDIFPDYEKNFKKFNSNFGYVNVEEFASTLNAFSHWSYNYTKGYLMVVDLQGIFNDGRYVLTDPAIHCKEPRFGDTNLGKFGMEEFFKGHKCNSVCAAMRLKSNRWQSDGSSYPDLISVLTTR